MVDSMKFGPEWLRNMKSGDSSGGISGSGSAPLSAPIKMAEFRYGREEMLALFDRTILPPDPLKQMQGLYVKEIQQPLALTQMTEEETRMWNRGINSDAALRLSKPGGPGVGPGGPRGAMSGRGGSVDRGRGRARGSYHYSRGLSYDDSENTNGYTRGMRNNYDRSQSGGGWGERNGGDTGDSPRKEFGSRGLSDTNWRRHRVSGGEEDDGWRASRPSDKWGRGNNNSWREGENWGDRPRTWEETSNSHPPPRKPWETEDNNLPEWAMENPSESGGSFDASGAFHGGTVYSDEEDTNNGSNQQRVPTRSEQGRTSSSQPRPIPQSKKEPPNITNGTSSSQETGAGDRDSSHIVPLRQSQSATSLATERRPPSLPHPITTSASFSGVNSHPSLSAVESKPQREQSLRKPAPSPLKQHTTYTNYIPSKPVEEPKTLQKPSHEDEMEQRLLNDADVFVSRLMDEEDGEPIPTSSNTSPSHPHPNTQSPIPNPNSDIRWVYQDPQGEIQGNFTPAEMTEWYNLGYFKPSLLVRRTGDEVFLPISEMKKFWKTDKPFEVDYHTLPPIKKNQPPLLPQTLPPTAPPAPALEDTILMQYQLHQQLLHQRQQAIFARLSQSEQFNNLSALDQRQLVAHQANLANMETLQGGMMMPQMQQHTTNPPTNSNVIAVIQMLAAQQQQQQHQQLQQQRLGAGGVPVQVGLPAPSAEPPLDPLQQIMSQIGLQGPTPTRPTGPVTPQNTPDDQRSFDQFLNSFRQRQATGAQPQPAAQPQQPLQPPQSVVSESVWGGTASSAPAFPGWSVPPGHPAAAPAPPQSLWADSISKRIKTEADILPILEEQFRAEEKKKEDLRKQEDLLRLKQEEEERERLRRIKEEEELERKRQEEEEKEREQERKRIQEAEERKKREAAAAKKAEQDRLRKEEEKKKKEEEKRRKEEEKRKQEEEKKKAEEERKKQEEEKKKQEEMAKRQNEALKRIQEQQQAQAQAQTRVVKAAPSPAPWTQPEPTGPSLADIQKTERKQQQQLREQQEMLRLFKEKQQQQQLQLRNSNSASKLNLKWAEAPNPAPTRVKSFAEIQAEEQERMAKQAEKEKAERMAASKEVPLPSTGSIWQTAPQSLTWNSNSPTSSVWGSTPTNSVSSNGPPGVARGFWDEVGNKATAKPQPQAQAKPQTKTKAKKEEASVMKLFEKGLTKTAKTEEFNKWCARYLQDVGNIDVPTFIDFLWTVESQGDIQEYVLMYLDEPRRATHFAAEFIIRRQRLLSNNPQAEMLEEASLPPSQPSNHFQEVKGKNKKVKKSKMTKVDSRILGFNVTAAPDRINVGDRDYGENI